MKSADNKARGKIGRKDGAVLGWFDYVMSIAAKIFESKRDNKKRTVKIFGFPVYVAEMREETTRKQFFLNGMIKIVKQRKSCWEESSEKNIELFGQPFMKIVVDEYFIRKYVCGKLIQTVDRKAQFKKRCFKHINRQYDDIYVLNANSGEINLFLTYVAEHFIKRNMSRKPLFVATQIYHIDLIQMIMPQMPYIYAPAMGIDIVCDDVVTIGDKRVFLIFPHQHSREVRKNMLNKPIGAFHYFTEILQRLDMKPRDLGYRQASHGKEVQDSMLQKVKTTGLNLDNFVFVVPHAKTLDEYSADFWFKLCGRLKKLGIDVFFNVSKKDKNPLKGFSYKTADLTFSEAFALARMSKQIVCLRSGLTELLLHAAVPVHIIYTRSYGISAERTVSGFGLKILSYIKQENLTEYNTGEVSEDEILENIMNSVCPRKAIV